LKIIAEIGQACEKSLDDFSATHADVSKLEEYVNFRPQTSVEEGVKRFVNWYLRGK
jgi:nucleoside-diphosphate-sugar epimerase